MRWIHHKKPHVKCIFPKMPRIPKEDVGEEVDAKIFEAPHIHFLIPHTPTRLTENHLAEVVRSKPGRQAYIGENATYPPILGLFGAYSRTLPQGVELLD